jgi:hypothetical protein
MMQTQTLSLLSNSVGAALCYSNFRTTEHMTGGSASAAHGCPHAADSNSASHQSPRLDSARTCPTVTSVYALGSNRQHPVLSSQLSVDQAEHRTREQCVHLHIRCNSQKVLNNHQPSQPRYCCSWTCCVSPATAPTVAQLSNSSDSRQQHIGKQHTICFVQSTLDICQPKSALFQPTTMRQHLLCGCQHMHQQLAGHTCPPTCHTLHRAGELCWPANSRTYTAGTRQQPLGCCCCCSLSKTIHQTTPHNPCMLEVQSHGAIHTLSAKNALAQ